VEQNTITLDYWIGERVSVHFVMEEDMTRFGSYSCTLQSADERGVLLRLSHHEMSSDWYSFFPWRRIARIEGEGPPDA
jgi:hypothetical protein